MWGTDGGFLRGCANTGQFSIVPFSDGADGPVPSATVVVNTFYPWGPGQQEQYTCTSSSPQFSCSATIDNSGGTAAWAVYANY